MLLTNKDFLSLRDGLPNPDEWRNALTEGGEEQ
jgi:hypothetical protein